MTRFRITQANLNFGRGVTLGNKIYAVGVYGTQKGRGGGL